MDETVTGGSAD